jgi:hypothetical protein
MALRRRQPPPPCACGCLELAERLAGYEADIAAMARAIVALRPKAARHTIEQGLTGWAVAEADARRIAALARKPG